MSVTVKITVAEPSVIIRSGIIAVIGSEIGRASCRERV